MLSTDPCCFPPSAFPHSLSCSPLLQAWRLPPGFLCWLTPVPQHSISCDIASSFSFIKYLLQHHFRRKDFSTSPLMFSALIPTSLPQSPEFSAAFVHCLFSSHEEWDHMCPLLSSASRTQNSGPSSGPTNVGLMSHAFLKDFFFVCLFYPKALFRRGITY